MMDELVRILQDGNHSLVVAGDGIRTFDGRGISDLYGLLTETPIGFGVRPWRTKWSAKGLPHC